MKKALRLVLLFTALFTILSVHTAFAATKITRSDISTTYGKYKFNFIKKTANRDTGYMGANMIGFTEAPKTVFRTKRGIALEDTKKQVLDKYGKTAIKKVKYKSDKLYIDLMKEGMTEDAAIIKKAYQYADYVYNDGKNEYLLRFYFDKKGIIKTILYFKNYGLF